ncbi:MAG: PDZ domain-containing protein [Bacteroidota bacterium]
MKKITTLVLLALAVLPFTSMAQPDKTEVITEKNEEPVKTEKPGKKETQEIIIRKNGDKEIKLKVEIDGDNITINGKPMSEFKDDNVTVNKRKMIITGGDHPMTWNFDGNGEGDWEKWGENFGKNFEQNWNFHEGEDDAAFLGVTTEKVDDGAKIVEISKGSAAEKAGLKKDDIIMKIDEEKISSPDALSDVIGFKKPKDEVKIKYKRNGKENNLKVALGKRKEKRSYSFNNPNGNFHMFTLPNPPRAPHTNMEGLNEDMLEIQQEALDRAFPRKKLGLKIQDIEDGNGVKVINVEDSSAAATAGLKKDDIITEINGKKIDNTDDAREELVPDEDKKLYKIKANRGGTEMNFDVKIPRKLKTANL